jgi:hypothetical protein
VSNTAQSSRSVPREPKAASPVGRWNRHSLPVGADAGPDGPAIRFIPDLVLQRLDDFSPLGPHAVPKMTGEVDDPSVLDGEAFITAFGHVLGVYTWDANGVPSLARIQSVLAVGPQPTAVAFDSGPAEPAWSGGTGAGPRRGSGSSPPRSTACPNAGPGGSSGGSAWSCAHPVAGRHRSATTSPVEAARPLRGGHEGQPRSPATSGQPNPTVSATTDRVGASTRAKNG